MAYGAVNVVGSSAENTDELKTILNELKENVGSAADSGGSTTEGTVNGKLNKVIEEAEDTKTSIKEMQTVDIPSIKEDNTANTTTIINNTAGIKMDIMNLNKQMLGEASPYGTGAWGDVEYDADTFNWGTKDFYGRYIIQCTSLHIPEGQTMTPPEKCNGVYILCQGDIIIDGDIDLRDKRLDATGSFSLATTLVIDGKEYTLAKGGDTVVGGDGGNGGEECDRNGVIQLNDTYSSGKGGTPTKTICGSVVGGGISSFGLGGTGIAYSGNGSSTSSGKNGTTQFGNTAAGSVVLVAKGSITLNGNINVSASIGDNPTAGTDAYSYSDGCTSNAHGGTGGNGALAPSGGGAVTIICNSFKNNGIINTKGLSFTSSDGNDGKDVLDFWRSGGGFKGGHRGKGGTFTSCAGEIKVYETGEAA